MDLLEPQFTCHRQGKFSQLNLMGLRITLLLLTQSDLRENLRMQFCTLCSICAPRLHFSVLKSICCTSRQKLLLQTFLILFRSISTHLTGARLEFER